MSTYRVPNGSLKLDLSDVKDVAALDGRQIDVRLNAGDIDVELPPGVNADVDADIRPAPATSHRRPSHRDGFGPSLTRTVTGLTSPDAPTSPSTSTPASARSPSSRTDPFHPTTRRHPMSDLTSTPPPDRRLKVPHLVFGLLFLGLAGIWALVVSEVINEDQLPVLAPALLIGAGVIGLAASLASARNRRSEPHDPAEPRPRPPPEPPAETRPTRARARGDHTEEIR